MTSLHVEIYGRGEPVVMVHGWAMHAGVWREFARHLGERYRVFCLDLPGHGRSSADGDFSLESVCRQLSRSLPDRPCHWLGWSMGGSIVLEMATRFPDRVASALLLASNPRFVEENSWPGMKQKTLEAFAENLQSDTRATLLRFLSLQIKGLPEFKSLTETLRRVIDECEPPNSETLADGLALLKQADLRSALTAFDKPLAVVLGGLDTLVPVTVGSAMRALNPKLQLHILDRAGHVPFLSHQEQLLTIVERFWEQ
ncbi:MAG: pimeloyl-ACP methyl ester esterase BioH [Gammaproteobacteria bacterium]